MELDEKTSEGSTPPKKPKIKTYNLRLGEVGKVIPVDSYEKDGVCSLDEKPPTGIKLEDISHLEMSKNPCSVMEIGYDTEFVGIDKLTDKFGKKLPTSNLPTNFNYLVSTQYYIHLYEISEDVLSIVEQINNLKFDLEGVTLEDISGQEKGFKLLNNKLDQLNKDFSNHTNPSVWSDVLFHSPQYWTKPTITNEDLQSHRLNLSDFIHRILQHGYEKGLVKVIPKNIHLLSHHNTSDLTFFKDMKIPQCQGEYHLEKFFTSIRKSISHDEKYITGVVDKSKYPKKKVKIRIYDTINLSPAGKGLKDIGELLDKEFEGENLKKLELEPGAIENMLVYRKSNTKHFCEYGLQDAKIPIYFSILMRGVVRKILGNKDWKAKTSLEQIQDEFCLPLTTTSIGEKFLKDIVWLNRDHRYYTSEQVDDIHEQYAKIFKRRRRKEDLPWINLLGYRTEYRFEYDKVIDDEGKISHVKQDKPKVEDRAFARVEDNMPIIKKTYYGGRNEQFFFGITPLQENKPFHDYDLVSAYPTAMMCVGTIDWMNPVNLTGMSTDDIFKIITDFENYASYYHIESFVFPSDTKYPTIPVRNFRDDGIVFPLEGGPINDGSGRCGTYLNGVEIYVARLLGCEMKLGNGVVFPMDKSFLPYEKFILTTLEQRREAEKTQNDFLAKFWKEMMNSLYGKTAQGISEKRVYDIQKDATKPLSESRITSYPIVSIVTAIVRGVLGVMMNNIASSGNYFIGNITTDGFCTDFPDDENLWKRICDNRLIKMWVDARCKMEDRNITSILQGVEKEKNIIEEKHTTLQYMGWRTRGQSTLKLQTEVGGFQVVEGDDFEKEEDEFSTTDIPTAEEITTKEKWDKYVKRIMNPKGGLKPPSKDKLNQNLQTTWWFMNRFEGMVYSADYLRGLKDIIKSKADSTNVSNRRKVSMDFDFKRQPDLSTLCDTNVEWVDISNHIKVFFNEDKKDATKVIPNFTTSFDEVRFGVDINLSQRRKVYTVPTFQTTPIKDINEYEELRRGWTDYIKFHKVDIDWIKLGFTESELRPFHIDREQWESIVDFIEPLESDDLVSFSDKFEFVGYYKDRNDEVEYFDLKGLKYLTLFYHHLKGKGMMNSTKTINHFFNLYDSGFLGSKDKGVVTNKTRGGDIRRLMDTIILCWKQEQYGLGEKLYGVESTTFAIDVYKTFWTESEIRENFKVSSDVSFEDLFDVVKKPIQNRMGAYNSNFNNRSKERRKIKSYKFYRTEDRERCLLLLKKSYPRFDIEPFLGSKSFGEWIEIGKDEEIISNTKLQPTYNSEVFRQITLLNTPSLSELDKFTEEQREEYIQRFEREYSEEFE